MKNKKVALVLGSGGARGLAQIGVIEELEKRGYKITSIAGSSMGAVIGAVYASGELDEFKKWICNLDRFKVFNLMDFTLTKQGFIKGDRVFNEIKKFVSSREIQELKIPFTAIAVDIKKGKEITFNDGDLFTAVRASVAIPSVLTPIYLEGKVLIDGGVINPLPLDKVDKSKADLMLAVDLNANGKYKPISGYKSTREKELEKEESKWNKALKAVFGEAEKKEKKHDYFDILNGSFDIMQYRLTEIMLKEHKPNVLIGIPKNAAKTFEFFKATELIAYGRKKAEEALDHFEDKSE